MADYFSMSISNSVLMDVDWGKKILIASCGSQRTSNMWAASSLCPSWHKSQLFTRGVQCYRYIVAVSILKMLSHSDRILKQCPDCHRLQCFKNRFQTYRKNRNKILAMKQKNDWEKYVPLFLGLFNVIASIKYMMCVLTW